MAMRRSRSKRQLDLIQPHNRFGSTMQLRNSCQMLIIIGILAAQAATPSLARSDEKPDIRVGAAAVNLSCDEKMVLAGFLEARYTKEQEGELRAVAVVIEKPGGNKVAIIACDVLWIPRDLADAAVTEIEQKTGIPSDRVLINATHTHHAPSTAASHGFGVSQ